MKRVVIVDNKKYTVEKKEGRYFVKTKIFGSKYWTYISNFVNHISICNKKLYNECITEFEKILAKKEIK